MIVNATRITADTAILAGPGSLFGVLAEASTGGSVIIYDNPTAASGTILFSRAFTTGDVIHFGGLGIRATAGLYADVSGTLTAQILWKG